MKDSFRRTVGKLSTYSKVDMENNLLTANTGTHFGILRDLSESDAVAGTNCDGDDDTVDI